MGWFYIAAMNLPFKVFFCLLEKNVYFGENGSFLLHFLREENLGTFSRKYFVWILEEEINY